MRFPPTPSPCSDVHRGRSFRSRRRGAAWSSWGGNTSNTRFQTTAMAGLTADQVPHLKLKWAFGFPGELNANGHPTYAGGRVFVGSPGGKVYSLDASTGCIRWYVDAGSQVRSAIECVSKIQSAAGLVYAAFFGDSKGQVWAVDASTGKQIWEDTGRRQFPVARLTSSPVFHDGKLYVGVASGEEGSGAVPAYEDAVSSGAVWWLSRCRYRETDLEDIHDCRAGKADEEEQDRDTVMGAIGCTDLEYTCHRHEAQGGGMSPLAITTANRARARATRSWRSI